MDSSDEVEHLKSRISQLENLVCGNLTTDSLSFSDQDLSQPSSLNVRVVPQSFIDRVGALENLLAASEADNNRLKRTIEVFQAETKAKEVEALLVLKDKEKEIQGLRLDIELLKKQCDVSTRKLESIEAYVNTLPSSEELIDAQNRIQQLEVEEERLQEKIQRLETRNQRLQKELFQKESVCQNALERLEQLLPLQVAQEQIVAEQSEGGIDCNDPELVRHYIISLKTQLMKFREIADALKAKNLAYRQEKVQYDEKLQLQELRINEYGEQVDALEARLSNTVAKLQFCEKNLRETQENAEMLRARHNSLEESVRLRSEQYETLVNLMTEIEMCTNELHEALSIVSKAMEGEDPDVDSLIALVDYEFDLADDINSKSTRRFQHQDLFTDSSGTLNMTWCINKWEKLKKSREVVSEVRKRLHAGFIKNIGEQCILQ